MNRKLSIVWTDPFTFMAYNLYVYGIKFGANTAVSAIALGLVRFGGPPGIAAGVGLGVGYTLGGPINKIPWVAPTAQGIIQPFTDISYGISNENTHMVETMGQGLSLMMWAPE